MADVNEEKDFDKDEIAKEVKAQSEGDATDEQALLDATEERLKILDPNYVADESDDDDDSTPEDDPADDSKGDDDSTPDDKDEEGKKEGEEEEKEDDDAAKDGDDDKDEDAQGDDKQKDKPQLSDAYYRAAIHNEMTKEEIVDFMKVNPDLATRTFGKMYEAMNRASKEFAEIGRFKKEQGEVKDKADDDDKPKFKKIDTGKLREEHGDGVVDIIDQLQDQIVLLNEQKPVVVVSDGPNKAVQDQADKHAADQVSSFFNSKDMVIFKDTYGVVDKDDTNWTALMPSEKMNRVTVIEYAEQLIEGAAVIGKEMSVDDALERAHLLVTEPIREQIIRDDIMGQVHKRSKSLTLKPTNKASVVADEESKGPKSDKDIISSAADRLAKVFPNG